MLLFRQRSPQRRKHSRIGKTAMYFHVTVDTHKPEMGQRLA